MKKTGKVVVAIMAILIVSISLCARNSYAYREGIKLDSKVGFPFTVTNGEVKMTISSSIGEHDLYYQAIEVKENPIDKQNTLKEEAGEIVNNAVADINKLAVEVEKKKEELKSATTDEEKQKIQDEIKKLEDETNKIDEEADKKVADINTKIRELVPDFDDGKWTKSEGDTFKLNVDYIGTKLYTVWVKVVDSEKNEYYNAAVLSANGNRKAVESVNIEKEEISLELGKSESLEYKINPTDAFNTSVTWKSDNEAVATIDNGVVTAKGEGTATITITTADGNKQDTCKVVVKSENSNNNNENNNGYDNTTANKPHANTGASNILAVVIAGIAMFAVIVARKYNNTKIK